MIQIRVQASQKPASLDRKEATARIKLAWAELGRMWHEQMLPRHFKPGAASEYGYRRRSRSYVKRKRRQKGHARPLEFSGRLKRQVLSSRRVSSLRGRKGDGSGGRVKITVNGPRYLKNFRSAPNQPDLAAELRAVSPREERKLTKTMDRRLTKELDK